MQWWRTLAQSAHNSCLAFALMSAAQESTPAADASNEGSFFPWPRRRRNCARAHEACQTAKRLLGRSTATQRLQRRGVGPGHALGVLPSSGCRECTACRCAGSPFAPLCTGRAFGSRDEPWPRRRPSGTGPGHCDGPARLPPTWLRAPRPGLASTAWVEWPAWRRWPMRAEHTLLAADPGLAATRLALLSLE